MSGTLYENVSDSTLWDLFLKGDMTALSVLYKEHYNLLVNFGMKYCPEKEFVKDCIQDTFVKICSSNRLSSTAYVRSYLLTALKNTISDKLSGSRLADDLDEHFFEMYIDDSGLQELFREDDEALRLSRRLVEAYGSLRGNQRMALYLRYVRGLSYKEISAVLNIHSQSSMNLVSRALASLRSRMMCGTPMIISLLTAIAQEQF